VRPAHTTGNPSRGLDATASLRAPFAAGGATALFAWLVIASAAAALTLVMLRENTAALLAMGVLPAAYVLCRWPESAASIVAFLLYTNAAVIAVRFHGAPFVVAAAFPLLLGIPIARNLLLRGEQLIIPRATPYIFAFFVIQLVGALFSIRPEEAITNFIGAALEGLVLYLLMVNAIRTPRVLSHVISTLLLAGALIGALVLYQQLTRTYDDEYGGFAQVKSAAQERAEERGEIVSLEEDGSQPRLAGPIGEKNRFAQIMAMLVPLAMFQYVAARSLRGQLAAVASLGLVMIGCALGFSRGAAVGLGMMFAVMIWMGHVRLRHLVLAAFGVVAVGIMVPQYAERLATIGDVASLAFDSDGVGVQNADGATRGRVTEMVTAGLVFADHPLLGVGPGMYEHHYVEYARIAGGRVRGTTRQAHSLLPGIAAEHGVFGLVAFLAVIVVSLRELAAARRRWTGLRPDLAHMATGLLLCIVVYLTTSVFLHAAYIRYFWFVLGLAGAASHLVAAEERSDLATLARRVYGPTSVSARRLLQS
jgi:hypothetical protein